MNARKHILTDEPATVAVGGKLAQAIQTGAVIYLHGDLGAGKTTFCRGVIQGLGHKGNVKSPTYTLVEPYELENVEAYHFDLYRLADPEELEFMGVRDYFSNKSICLIEWPEKGGDLMPEADLDIILSYHDEQRELECRANTPRGIEILTRIS
jgi:tRNA threonylcarbamoyladenosine biosynthesis protein TsaE